VIIVIFKSEFDEWVAMWIISKKWLWWMGGYVDYFSKVYIFSWTG
jgi:hypothetical protein